MWLNGEDMTQSFKPMKMALRMTHLEDWAEFQDKYNRIRATCEQLYRVELTPEEVERDIDEIK